MLRLNMIRVPKNINTNILIQTRCLSEVNKKYIELVNQNLSDKKMAFWSGFIGSSILMPYSACIGVISSFYTESVMLKNVEELERLTRLHKLNEIPLNKINAFVQQPSHKHYFYVHNLANGMFCGSLFITTLTVAMYWF